jgi:hypothetical protein
MLQPVRLSSQFFYHSKRKAITELKDAFFYAGIKVDEPVAFDECGYLIEKREAKSGQVQSVNCDIRISPFPLGNIKYLMAVYLVDGHGSKIERNDKVSKHLQIIRDSKELKVE